MINGLKDLLTWARCEVWRQITGFFLWVMTQSNYIGSPISGILSKVKSYLE
jgi:hypothetical protein